MLVGVFVMAVEEVQVVSQFHTSVNRILSLAAGTEITQYGKILYNSEIVKQQNQVIQKNCSCARSSRSCKLPLWAGALKMQLSSQAQIQSHALIYYSCLLLTWTRLH